MTHVALLRAVNLAGRRRVRMADLRELLAGLGFEDPRSLLASGNLVFRAGGHTPAELEERLARAASERLDLETDFFVRTAKEWAAIVEDNPFPEEAEEDPAHLVVTVLKDAPEPERVAALREAIRDREAVEVRGRVAYVHYPDGIGRSRLTASMIEKHLRTRATGRNWNTTLKLLALADG